MGALLKIVFYFVLAVALYVIGKGVFSGSINQETTIGQVANEVGVESGQILNAAETQVKQDYETGKITLPTEE